MDRRVDDTAPDSSTLWLAIGLGGFSVFASFFLAIYCSSGGIGEETTTAQANGIDVVEQAAE